MTIFQSFKLFCSDVSYDDQFILWSFMVFCFRGIELLFFHFFFILKGNEQYLSLQVGEFGSGF